MKGEGLGGQGNEGGRALRGHGPEGGRVLTMRGGRGPNPSKGEPDTTPTEAQGRLGGQGVRAILILVICLEVWHQNIRLCWISY